MKRNNKKGFTIVELVIVIAVIAILSAVLIPTFGTLITDANQSAAQQKARNAYTSYIQEYSKDSAKLDADLVIVADGFNFTILDGQLIATDAKHACETTNIAPTGTDAEIYVLTKCTSGTTDCAGCGFDAQ